MSLNDPNWGRGGSRGPQGPGGGNQGPPDLDELWRNFNRRLSELFGRRRRGGGDPPPGPPSGRALDVGYRNNVRTKVLKESLMLTDDENIIDLQFAVQYVVKDSRDFIFKLRRPDESAMQIAETAMREVIGKNRMDAILYETQVDVANKARDLMQAIHDRYGTGIQISTVTIQNAQPPEQVQA